MLFDWFNDAPLTNPGRVVLPQFSYLKRELQENLDAITDYYHNRPLSVKNEHLLVKILKIFNASMSRDIFSYLDRADDQADEIASTLGMAGPHRYGKVFSPGPFYGEGSHEIILSDDREFDPAEAYRDWRNLEPVRVLRHPFNDLSAARADGDYSGSNESGVSVISICIPLLCLQFRGWWHEERTRGNPQSPRTIQEFVARFPLTNMVRSHLDIALFNRMATHLYYGPDSLELAPFKRTYPFYIQDMTKRMDFTLEQEITNLKRQQMRFDQLLQYIPAISATDLRTVIALPRVPQLRQVTWTLIVARLPLIRFLVRLNVVTGARQNNWYLSRLRMYLVSLEQSKTWSNVMSVPVLRDIETMIANDIEPYL